MTGAQEIAAGLRRSNKPRTPVAPAPWIETPRLYRAALTIGVIVLCCLHAPVASAENRDATRDLICRAIREAIAVGGSVAGERIFHPEALQLFYGGRACRPAWGADDDPRSPAQHLLEAARRADREGLNPADYHTSRITALLGAASARRANRDDPAAIRDEAALDLLLTDAFLLLAAHLTRGRINPATIDPEWNIPGRAFDLVFLLQSALERNHLAETLRDLPPATEGYRLLREALASYRAFAAAGGWPRVPGGPALRAGDRGPRVGALRRRLAATADLDAGAAAGEHFDAALAEAVRDFQRRHGLEDDGVVGKRTLAAINTPAALRARQIEANLERLRWLPRDLGGRFIMANIPDFRLAVIEADTVALQMRIIAGRQARRTPFFTGSITAVMLNPSWTVPGKILVEDKLPLILENRDYLREQHFRVFRAEKGRRIEVDPADIDWATLDPERSPYRLRQDPGPFNALGRIKFPMPNRYDVYLHDTPAKELFARTERTFSSGCIRVEKALDLAAYLLRPDPSWPRPRLEAAIDAGKTVTVPLREPMPVYLLYWTAWIERDGSLQFREDVYDRDPPLEEALLRTLIAP